MTNDGINTYTYDAEGNITAVSGNASATYVYNALNQRVRTTVNSGTPTEFVFNAGKNRGQTGRSPSPYLSRFHPATFFLMHLAGN